MRRIRDWRRQDVLAIIAFLLFIFLYLNIHALHDESTRSLEDHIVEETARWTDREQKQKTEPLASFDSKGPANETLGFGAILAVSKQDSSRKKSLLEAASLTNLHITVPDQPRWTDHDVQRLKDKQYSILSKGSAMAWLGHLNAVKAFVDSGLDTALIIEDDVDWEVHIRHHQVPLVAKHMRDFLDKRPANRGDHYTQLREQEPAPSYWGDLNQWEMLYIGHCGDYFDLKFLPDLPHTTFYDPTVPDFEYLHPETSNWLEEAGLRPHERMVHRSKQPLCSFAYALTRRSALRLLDELSHEELGHGTWSFDVRLLEACRDLGWKCWSVNPELFHHMDQRNSDIASVDGGHLFEADEGREQKDWNGQTPNIACGARSPRFMGLEDEQKDVIRHMGKHLGVCTVEALRKVDPDAFHHPRKDPL